MPNRKKPRRRSDRGPTRPTVASPARLTIITIGDVDQDPEAPRSVDLRREVELVKAGLLYGDRVELLSWAYVFLRLMEPPTTRPNPGFCEFLATADDDVLSQLVDDENKSFVLSTAQRLYRRMDESAYYELIATLKSDQLAEYRAVFGRLHDKSQVSAVDLASNRKLLRHSRLVGEEDPAKTLDLYYGEVKRYLEDPTRFVLLDADTAELAKSMIDHGVVIPPKRSEVNAGEAALGAGFVSRLPLLPNASMEDVIQVRQDLSDPLIRYRAKIVGLRERLQIQPFDKNIGAEVDAAWRSDVEPALLEIREAMSDHTLAKELLTSVGTDLGSFLKGSGLPAGITVLTAQALDVGGALMAASTAAAAAAPPMMKAAIAKRKVLTQSKRHDLYYLYEVDRRLA